MNAADNTGAETAVQPEQDNNNPNKNKDEEENESFEQATQLAFFLTSVDAEDDIEDTIRALKKRGINPVRLIERWEEAQEQMSEMSDEDMRKLWSATPRASQPVRRKAVRTAVKKA